MHTQSLRSCKLTQSHVATGGGTGASDIALIKTLFDAVGLIEVVDEKLLSAVTGVSGSGPAYVYMIIEAMSDGGVRAGLPRAVATKLAAQTRTLAPSACHCCTFCEFASTIPDLSGLFAGKSNT